MQPNAGHQVSKASPTANSVKKLLLTLLVARGSGSEPPQVLHHGRQVRRRKPILFGYRSLLAEDEVDDPAPANVGAGTPAVRQDVFVVAPRVLKGIG